MDNAVYADPDKLDALSDDLSKTPLMLENIFRENAEMIARTKNRLNRTLDMLERNAASAHAQLAQAEAALQQAQFAAYDDEYVDLSFYWQMVYNAQARVSHTESAFGAVKNLTAEYEAAAEHYRREESVCFEDYRNFLAKGRTIAGKYAALVRASAAAISGEGGASSARDRIISAGARGLSSPPSPTAKVAAALVGTPPGIEDASARLLQTGWNAGVAGSAEFMAAAIRQHGPGPAAELQNREISKAIAGASDYEGEPLREQDYYDEKGVKMTGAPPHD